MFEKRAMRGAGTFTAMLLVAGLAACGGGGSGGSDGGSGGGTTPPPESSITTFPEITSCLQANGLASPLQDQLLNGLVPALSSTPNGAGAAGLTTVLSSFLNTSSLLSGGLQNLGLTGNTADFTSSLTSATSALTCGTKLLSNLLAGIVSTSGGPTDTSQITAVASQLTGLLSSLSSVSSALQGGQSVDLTSLTSSLNLLSMGLPGLFSQLPAVGGQASQTAVVGQYLTALLGNYSNVFAQLGSLNPTGLSNMLPLPISGLSGLLSGGTADQLGIPTSLTAAIQPVLAQVLGNQQSIITQLFAPLTGLLSGGLLGGLLGPLLGGLGG